jgi:hypothetical protein
MKTACLPTNVRFPSCLFFDLKRRRTVRIRVSITRSNSWFRLCFAQRPRPSARRWHSMPVALYVASSS